MLRIDLPKTSNIKASTPSKEFIGTCAVVFNQFVVSAADAADGIQFENAKLVSLTKSICSFYTLSFALKYNI
jgi:hypothetical protein